jgi:hypothetical protein
MAEVRLKPDPTVVTLRRLILAAAIAALLTSPSMSTAAQTLGSGIVGVVKDPSGAIVPGVAVELVSPALIGGPQTVYTDAQGQYRFVDLRPGTYSLTFTLDGFQTTRNEGVVLRAAFTATINVVLATASLQESVTVTGVSPLVDVRTNVSERSISQELLETVPTGRGIQAVAALVPGVTSTRPDVGGSETHQNTTLSAHGSETRDTSWNSDGLDITGNNGGGGIAVTYFNQAMEEEVSVQSKGLPAEIGGGGIFVNMITKDGGNQFKGSLFLSFTDAALQADNVSESQRARGMVAPARVDSLLDINPGFGGPLIKDRIWFLGSFRYWRNNRFEANTFNPDGSQALDRQLLLSYSGKITTQVNPTNRVSFFIDWNRKHREERRDRTSSYQFISPEATKWQRQGGPAANVRWTSTLRPNYLLEAGFSLLYIPWFTIGQPAVDPLTLPRIDLGKSLLTGRVETDLIRDVPQNRTFSLFNSWFPKGAGSHAIKFGMQYNDAPYYTATETGGLDLTARFRNDAPVDVVVRNTPVENRVRLQDLGVFFQDSWTIKQRLTLNAGMRFEKYIGSIDEQTGAAGVFVPARTTDKIGDVPNWTTFVPRLAVAFDLTGKGTTAIKANVSQYMQKQGASFVNQVNPLRLNTETRTWVDANGDRFPQLAEIGPDRGTLTRGATVRIDPGIERPFQWEQTVTLEHQFGRSLGATIGYYHRQYYRSYQTVNAALTDADWIPVTVTNPLDGTPMTIYNQTRASASSIDNVVKSFDDLGSRYNGFEVTFDKRMANNFALFGGYTLGAHKECTSASTNPNDRINSCGRHPYDTTHMLNLSGVYRFPAGVQLSGHFQQKTGAPLRRDYTFTSAQVPGGLTQASQLVILVPRGDVRQDNVSLLDLRVSRRFTLGARTIFEPTIDLYNLLNENAAIDEVETVGPALGSIARNVDGRTLRFAARILF